MMTVYMTNVFVYDLLLMSMMTTMTEQWCRLCGGKTFFRGTLICMKNIESIKIKMYGGLLVVQDHVPGICIYCDDDLASGD